MPLLTAASTFASGEDAGILPNNVIYTIHPQNGDCFMTTDSVTSLRPIYKTLLTEWRRTDDGRSAVVTASGRGR